MKFSNIFNVLWIYIMIIHNTITMWLIIKPLSFINQNTFSIKQFTISFSKFSIIRTYILLLFFFDILNNNFIWTFRVLFSNLSIWFNQYIIIKLLNFFNWRIFYLGILLISSNKWSISSNNLIEILLYKITVRYGPIDLPDFM